MSWNLGEGKIPELINGEISIKDIIIFICILIFLGIMVGHALTKHSSKPTVKIKVIKCFVPKVVYRNKKGVILNITYKTLAKDLATNYNFLSKNQQIQILNAIKKANKIYGINPLVIYSLISIESSFRFYTQSPKRLVINSDGKKQYDKAIGLCSIIYSIWGKQLKKVKILSTKTELYDIESNILAGSYILRVLKDRNKGNIIKALEAYFGKSNYAKIYQKKIRAKIGYLVEKEIL